MATVVTPSSAPSLAPAALRSRLAEFRAMGLVALQLAVLGLVIAGLRIESPAFQTRVVPLAFGGALVHHFLPARWRPWAFVALSLTGFMLVFGGVGTAWFVLLATVVLAWLHLPIPYWGRIAGWAVMAAGLGAARAGLFPVPWPGSIWPVFGSIFMLRMIVYLYDLRHQKGPTDWKMALSYFFMLPAVVFPFFPIVDYGMFKRTYYDRPALQIYQTGIHWMVRGLTHLVVYRLVYQFFTLAPSDVTSGAELVQFLLANFALYLRVSGQFHLIVGLLHLFGFRLPETHRFFFVASSFTDLWRRINIYWKDFMQKVFYMPVFYPLAKKRGEAVAIVVGSAVTIFATWFLHSYQWFWLLGRWLFTMTDVLFWVLLGVFLVMDSLRERKRGRARPGSPETKTLRYQVSIGLRAIGVFTIMCSLWGFWNAPTLAEGLNLFRVDSWDWRATGLLAAALLAVGFGAGLAERIRPPAHEDRVPPTMWKSLRTALPILAIWATSFAAVGERLPDEARGVLRELRVAELNARDAAQLQRGYYEELVGVNRFNGELWNVYVQRGSEWPNLQELGGLRQTGDLLRAELKPFLGLMFHGHPFRTNAHGMRDGAYDKEPAAGTHRVAVLGPSYVMGDGVPDGYTFEAQLETRLNRERPVVGPARWEFLNFGVSEYSPLSNLIILENGRVFGFRPSVVIMVSHPADMVTSDHVIEAVRKGYPLKYDFLQRIVDSVKATPDLTREELVKRLRPFDDEILTEVYKRMAELCRANGTRLVWALVPTPAQTTTAARQERVRQIAASVGLERIDLGDIYAGRDEKALIVADFDKHPNVEGHQLIADRLYTELLKRPHLLGARP
ncbi:MAG: hypothetical protein H7066_17495 [Cytophagaceae bacterium]|nr:hypothetical protein [Gemmatimonadaceae bacterium]